MSTKSHNLTPLASRILEIVASHPQGATRKQIGEALNRKNGITSTNDNVWLDKLTARGHLTCTDEPMGFKPRYVYRVVKE